MKLFVTVLSFVCAATLNAATPTISNREPLLDEIGYRPADNSIAQFNPPSFAWLHEKSAKTYCVQWSVTPDFQNAFSATNLPFNCYTHNRPLKPETYFWRYRFENTAGEKSDWSLVRHFTIEPDAVNFPMPSREERRQLVPKNHPRLFVRPEDLPRLRELSRGREASRFADLRRTAEKLIDKAPPSEPDKMGSSRNKKDVEAIQYWWPNRERTAQACDEAEILAFVYLITSEKKFGDAARKRILLLAKWDPDGPTNFKLNCEAAKPLLHRLSRAYDWAHDVFSQSERELIQKVIARRIQDAWESGEVGKGVGHINRPFNSHSNRTWHKLGESGIVFLGEIPEAETWLDYALNKFYACYPVWSDEDGGWHEGGAYYAGYMSKAVWWLEAARVALRIDGFQKPFFAQIGDFPLYMVPPNAPNLGGFGDLSFRNTSSSWGSFMEYFIRMGGRDPDSRAGYWRWWSEQGQQKPSSGIFGFLYHANLPSLPPAKAPADLPASKVFRGIGIASLHTTLLNSSNDVHFILKASPFGSQSHGHNPQNTFQLNAYGESLLDTCVYRDLHGSEFHYQWAHKTAAHNGVLVNGKGQLPHSAKSRGRIVDFTLTPEWDYVAGNAVEAYEGRLQRFDRRVLFVKPANDSADQTRETLILIYDDLVAPEPAQFQFMLHAGTSFRENKKASQWHVQKPNAGVTMQYLPPDPLKFKQTKGWPFEAIRGSLPDQWHLEAATTSATSQLGMLTLIVPHRGNKQPSIKAERLESDTALGARISMNGKKIFVAFKKANIEGEAELAGTRFETPTLVK